MGLSLVCVAPPWVAFVWTSYSSEENFRRETIWFEVADLSSPYHILLGSPAIAKFMMYVFQPYLKMKISGPAGPIAVCRDYKKSLECSSAGSKLADALVIEAERRQLDKVVAMAQEVTGMFISAEHEDQEIRGRDLISGR